MRIINVNFIGSFPKYTLTPNDNLPAFAFIGRSNVGKSSLINMLTQKKQLAKVSHTPGKTQLINYFEVDQKWYLVDLPGYGYAKLSKTKRKEFKQMIETFLIKKETLACTFVLIDSRHELQEIDREFIGWCGEIGLPIVLVYTKLDKLKAHKRAEHIERIENKLLEEWEHLPNSFETSSNLGLERDEILNYINRLVEQLS